MDQERCKSDITSTISKIKNFHFITIKKKIVFNVQLTCIKKTKKKIKQFQILMSLKEKIGLRITSQSLRF